MQTTADDQYDQPAERTVLVLDLLRRFRFLTARQLQLAVGCAEVDLLGLEDTGLVLGFGLADPFRQRESERVYALTRQGAQALMARKNLDRSEVPYLTPGQRQRSLLTLQHTLARNECALALEHACRDSADTEMLGWEHRPERIADAAFLYDEKLGSVRVPLVPDGVAILRHRGTEHVLIVEIDRGTVGIPRMTLRYRGYAAWWENGGPERKYGVRASRVLTVAPTEKRTENLRAAARKAIRRGRGSRLLWFATEDAVQIGGDVLHAPAWRLAHTRNGQRYALFDP